MIECKINLNTAEILNNMKILANQNMSDFIIKPVPLKVL